MLKSYNNFTTWESQDDFLTAWGRLLETYWVTWLRNGRGLTLWPKTNKLLLTNDKIRGIDAYPQSTNDDTKNLIFWDSGEIYRFADTDLTPSYTHSLWYHVVWTYVIQPYQYFIVKDSFSSANITIMRETVSNVNNWTFATINETWLSAGTINHLYVPPYKQIAWQTYIWGLWKMTKYDSSAIATHYSYFGRYIVWFSIHQWTFLVYTSEWKVFFWNWLDSADASFSNRGQELWFIPRKVIQWPNYDYVISDDWQVYIWWGAEFQQLTYKRYTNRGNDNSQYVVKQDFTPNKEDWQLLTVARDRVYIAENGVYEFGNLLPWLPKGLHKSIAYNHEWIAIDDVYAMYYNSMTKQVLFAYQAWASYWVDYIDLESMETNQTWYAVTEVFSGYNEWIITFQKQVEAIRYATLNTSWSNYIKLYKRVDNWTWELFKTINNATDTIDWKNLRTEKDSFLDWQFKIELYNSDKWVNPPILPWLQLQYGVKPI